MSSIQGDPDGFCLFQIMQRIHDHFSSMENFRQIEAQGSESGDPLKEVSLLDVELVDPETFNCSC